MHMDFQAERKHATSGSYQSFDISFCVTTLFGTTDDHHYHNNNNNNYNK